MEKLLTVVVPAYNAKDYLSRCLESLIDESIMDLVQVIVVNDGSKDNTSEIAHNFASKYPNTFEVIDKDNGNYGSCMNVGLKKAVGKYFRTLDSDDWYDKESYVKFVKMLSDTDADMLFCEKYKYYYKQKSLRRESFINTIDTDKDLNFKKEYFSDRQMKDLFFVANICYKTEVIRKSGLVWSEGVFYSDNEYDYWPLKYVKTIRFVPLPVYVYVYGTEGQSVAMSSLIKNQSSYLKVANKILDDYLINNDPTSEIYDLQLYHLTKDVFKPVYKALLVNGKEYRKKVAELDKKMSNNEALYSYFGNTENIRNLPYKYVKKYRKKMPSFWIFKSAFKVMYMRQCRRKN